MTEYLYTSQGDGTQKAPVRGNATGSPIALGTLGAAVLPATGTLTASGTSILAATIGTAILVGGTVTVANAAIGATTKI